MNKIFSLIFFLVFILSFSQNLKYEDFKVDRFYIPIKSNVDTLYIYNANTDVNANCKTLHETDNYYSKN